jgi:hypothetical protein
MAKVMAQGMSVLQHNEHFRDRDHLMMALSQAQLLHHNAPPEHLPVSGEMHPDDMYLNLVKSAISDPSYQPADGGLTGYLLSSLHHLEGWLGIGRYEKMDPGWLSTLSDMLQRSIVPFPDHQTLGINPITAIPDGCTIAVAGDWGTGNASSLKIAKIMAQRKPEISIHLGDVYYAGTENEERLNLIGPWPQGSLGSYTLNSNHEMYSGGHGLFEVALKAPVFQRQRGLSYFALEHARAMIIGVDTAYAGSRMDLYQTGCIQESQLPWLKATAMKARSTGKRIILMTHHHGVDLAGAAQTDYLNSVLAALGGGPDWWFWGHVHAGASFTPKEIDGRPMRARCLGHGGIPYAPIASNPALDWIETDLAHDPDDPDRGRNGCVVLTLDAQGMREEFVDEFANVRKGYATAW